MELRAGYKQTEAGVIPEEWDFSALGELISEMRGGAPLSPSDFKDSGVKVLPKGGVGRTGWLQVKDSEMQFCSSQYARAHRRNQVDETFTIVVLRDLVPSGPSIGLMVKIREPETYVLAQGVYGFKASDRVDPGYLVQLSNTNWYRKLANSIMVGSTQVHITNTAFKRARVPLPTKTEQQAIAEALSDADALIESLYQLITKKRQINQGAMQELLTGKRRLPGFSGGWEVKCLNELAEIDPEQLSSNTQPDYEFKYISLEDVDFGALRGHSLQVFDSAPSRARRRLRIDDLLVSTVRPNLKSHLWFRDRSANWVCSTGFSVVRCFESLSHPGYVFAHLFAEGVSKQIDALLTGSNYPAINSRDVRQLQIPVPKLEEQAAIATVLSDMDTELTALESRLAKARQIKQGMMQALLTGRIRLL